MDLELSKFMEAEVSQTGILGVGKGTQSILGLDVLGAALVGRSSAELPHPWSAGLTSHSGMGRSCS